MFVKLLALFHELERPLGSAHKVHLRVDYRVQLEIIDSLEEKPHIKEHFMGVLEVHWSTIGIPDSKETEGAKSSFRGL